MESWALGVPVIVHADCAVTRYHALQSGGGFPVKNALEFAAVVAELEVSPDLVKALGAAGKRYVHREYSWDAVLKRLDGVLSLFDAQQDDGVGAH